MTPPEIVGISLLLFASAVSGLHLNHYDEAKHKETKKPYSFSYGIKDDYRGTNFERREESDGRTVTGSYTVQLPDGRKQTVKYEADHQKGFVADVSYYGEAKYPPPSKEPPFVVRVVGHKLSENDVHHSLHPIPKSVSVPEQPKHLLPQPIEGEKEPLQSAEVSEITEVDEEEVRRQEHPLRPRPVFHQHARKIPDSEKRPHFNQFDPYIRYQHPRVHLQQKPVLAEDDGSTFHHSGSPFDDRLIIQKNNLKIGDDTEDDFLDETTGIKSFHTRIGQRFQEIPLSLLRGDPFHLEDTLSNSYIPRYASSLVNKPSLSTVVEGASFNYDDLEIGRSLYPLRLQGTHPNTHFARRSPLLITPQKHYSGDEESVHSDEQREKPLQDFGTSDAGHFHFLTDEPQHHRSVPHSQNPSIQPPVYNPTELEKPISREEPLHQAHHFHAEDERSTFKENSSVSAEASDHPSKSEAPSRW